MDVKIGNLWQHLCTFFRPNDNSDKMSKSENVKMGKEYKLMRRGLVSNVPLEISFKRLLLSEL